MANGGRVEGITSDKIDSLKSEAKKHRDSALAAIIDFYVSNDEEGRQRADERARAAYRQMASAVTMSDGLKELQADSQAARQQIADWLKIESDASLD